MSYSVLEDITLEFVIGPFDFDGLSCEPFYVVLKDVLKDSSFPCRMLLREAIVLGWRFWAVNWDENALFSSFHELIELSSSPLNHLMAAPLRCNGSSIVVDMMVVTIRIDDGVGLGTVLGSLACIVGFALCVRVFLLAVVVKLKLLRTCRSFVVPVGPVSAGFGFGPPLAAVCSGEEFGYGEVLTSWTFDGSAWLARAMALLHVNGQPVLDMVFRPHAGPLNWLLINDVSWQRRLLNGDVSASGRVPMLVVSLTIPTFVLEGKGCLQSC
ncbi:hypothetical protein L195_g027737 [Trifolium pratense]|uniref:Uncharacterized protein n=1 Tax=Trifolium pratense TaxID=57577 RepID=A0A2K3KZY6_TRIPR|nr:hypothetical protein L195_g027737 [Trifolium pratense]